MTDAAEEATETLSGDYVITATQSEITYAMSLWLTVLVWPRSNYTVKSLQNG